MIRSFAHQGYYNLPTMGSVDMAFRYTLPQRKAIVSLYANDLFGTSRVVRRTPSLPYKEHYNSLREFGASFAWKFAAR
ncbi:MAG: outer membrane beta-barrel family protein [Mediterranea sp.]|jgi:hypothetical protein|nr:outer membrane beta-barrel family protein [Mediterranea sp.]